MKIKINVFFCLLFLSVSSYGNNSDEYNEIIQNLRCLVCQNQSLAESDASLAKDLRQKVVEMLSQGKDKNDIYEYMRERYSDYVLYEPPKNLSTYFLWYGPFLVLFLTLGFAFIKVKNSKLKNINKKKNSTVNLQNSKDSSLFSNNKIILIILLLLPLISIPVYLFSSDYASYKIKYFFADKEPIVNVKIQIDDQITELISGEEVMFVYARKKSGMKAPLAINIVKVDVFKDTYFVRLDKTMNMIDGFDLSSAKEVEVIARITKYQTAQVQKGDLLGASIIDNMLNKNNISIKINRVFNNE